MTPFEQALKKEIERIRESLAETNATSMDFSINTEGRINDGDLRIEFSLGDIYRTGGQVKGGNLENVIREYKRRFGWDEVNTPLCLPRVEEPVF